MKLEVIQKMCGHYFDMKKNESRLSANIRETDSSHARLRSVPSHEQSRGKKGRRHRE